MTEPNDTDQTSFVANLSARLPDGWGAFSVGSTTLVVDDTLTIRYVHVSDYFGGDYRTVIARLDRTDDDAAHPAVAATTLHDETRTSYDTVIDIITSDAHD